MIIMEFSQNNKSTNLSNRIKRISKKRQDLIRRNLNSNIPSQKKTILRELASSYLLKDILQLTTVKHSDKLYRLLQLLALQIGKTVSLAKLSNALDMSFESVERYIDLLDKAFVIYRLSGYSRNKSKEISKMDKIYFYDVGIRNTVLDNFTEIELRNDAGDLWEKFLISERIKRNSYHDSEKRMYFWRTYGGTEIDLIEEGGGKLFAYEIKYSNTLKHNTIIPHHPNEAFN